MLFVLVSTTRDETQTTIVLKRCREREKKKSQGRQKRNIYVNSDGRYAEIGVIIGSDSWIDHTFAGSETLVSATVVSCFSLKFCG